MYKKIISIVLTLILVLALSACGTSKPEVTEEAKSTPTPTTEPTPTKALTSVDKIKQAGKIVLGTSADFPPYESHEIIDGKDTIVGFDIDITQAVADKLGVKLEINDTKFDGLLPMLMDGKINFIAAGMTPTEERKQSVDFSQVYYNAEQILVIKEDNTAIKAAADMNGKKIGAQLGSTSEKAAKTVQGIKYKAMDKVDQLLLEVKSNRLDGVVVENTVAEAYVKKIGGLQIIKMAELNTEEGGSAIAVQKGDTELQKVVDEVINELKSSGKYDELVEKWFK